jgi:microcystin-dependent protein
VTDQYVAEIRIFGCNFPPNQWAFCDGQLLPVSQNSALFSLLGTVYGGNGQSNFALPDLQGRAPMHPGTGPGLTQRALGESAGSDTTTLLINQMPQHTHAFGAVSSIGDNNAPSPNVSLARSHNATVYAPTGSAPTAFAPQAVGLAGGSQPHNNVQPSLVLNFCIALQGIFPQRS